MLFSMPKIELIDKLAMLGVRRDSGFRGGTKADAAEFIFY
jgi:hypothetical protein